jgi:hypothetical protein
MGEAKLNGNVEVKEKNSPESPASEAGASEQGESTESNQAAVSSDQAQ